MAERYPEQYDQFFHKFDAGEYYECHDLLEEIWMEDKTNKFLQGLLQLAVGLYHYECGNVKGARWMLGNARKYLTRYLPVYWDLKLGPVISYIDDCMRLLPDTDSIPYEEAKQKPLPRYRFERLVHPDET
ncbi:DUF309 domain-containing protein [Brevibacillus humidisoli]|uniref:DUF309 domain-containing protein n=1 Tax=Brevibacillus humidisoli TaxID=2895522 RepID=UPI001E5D3E8D|nr:DUF309 domain-containing protein [Brevibacillus humidisoli]UFJ39647.1 DUF309 domain-containing protein [Brevibacillus humidisoli]